MPEQDDIKMPLSKERPVLPDKVNKKNIAKDIPMEFLLDQKIYSAKAIKRAAYELEEKANINIAMAENGKIRVTITPNKTESASTQSIIDEFNQLVLDHQVRIEVEEDTRLIRQIIITQAFFPCENIEDIIKN